MPEYLAPGVYVEEVSFRPKSIEGVSTSTTAFVGPTRKGPLPGTPEVITSFGEFTRIYGGLANLSFVVGEDANPQITNYMAHAVRSFFDNGGARLYIGRTFVPRTNPDESIASTGLAQSNLIVDDNGLEARFIARMPGSGLNGSIRVFEKRLPATFVTMNSAPEGSMLRLGGDDSAQPAVLHGGAPNFVLEDGDELILDVEGNGPVTITFNGESAEFIGGSALPDPVTINPGSTLDVTVGGLSQSIALTDGNIPLADLLAEINVNLRRGYARLEGTGELVIGSDMRGTFAEVTIDVANTDLDLSEGTSPPGTGNVGNLEAVTVSEIDGLLQAAGLAVRATLPPSTGNLTLSTTATGEAATLAFTDSAARVALGFTELIAQGEDGIEPEYYLKNETTWTDVADAALDTTTPLPSPAELVTMNLEAEDADGNTILYEDLGFGATHPRFIGTVLVQEPSRRSDAMQNPYYFDIDAAIDAFTLHAGVFGSQTENTFAITGGDDGAEPPVASTIVGAVAYEDALEVLEEIEDISIIAAPGHSAYSSYQAVQNSLISHAERMRYRIAVLDSRPGQSLSEVRELRSHLDTKYAALYYPWVMIANPLARPSNDRIPKEIALPPSGFVTGIYARNDVQRGVWKAPANEVVRGALRFEREINHRQQEVINPEGINCLRYFYGRGNRVWGARTISSDPEWKYVNVRRYFIFLEHSIDRSTQWAVFEANGEKLWASVRETVSAFLYNEWRNGALLGSKPEEAYFVRCDRSTMTQNDLDNGRLVCEIGVAVLKPAEFVIFRIGQKTADAQS